MQAEERLREVERLRRLDEERSRQRMEEERASKIQQKVILGKTARPKLSFGIKPKV